MVGGYVGYLLVAEEHTVTYVNDQPQGEPVTIDIKGEAAGNKLNKWDFGVVLGWGYEFQVGLILSLVSNIGISKINDTNRDSLGRNFTGNLSLGYNFAKLLG